MSFNVGRWLASSRIGMSSQALAAATLGAVPDKVAPNYPHDSDDFSRCHALCTIAPEAITEGLPRLAAISGPWHRLAARWSDLSALLEDSQFEACTALINECVYPDGRRSGWIETRRGPDGRWDSIVVERPT